jgi:hypothetical protein
MSVIDKVVNEWAFRCKKGYPDMNNPDDMKILKEIYSEYGIVMEGTTTPKGTTFTVKGQDWKVTKDSTSNDIEAVNAKKEARRFSIMDLAKQGVSLNQPKAKKTTAATPRQKREPKEQVPKTTYDQIIVHELNTDGVPPIEGNPEQYTMNQGNGSINITNAHDKAIFQKLYKVAPPKAKDELGSAGSKGSGHGEIAVYWLLSQAGNKVEDSRGGSNADLLVNNIGVEVKSFPKQKDMIQLGRIGKYTQQLVRLNTVFGINALLSEFSGEGRKTLPPNAIHATTGDVVEACEHVLEVYKLKPTIEQYNLGFLNTIFTKIEQVLEHAKEAKTAQELAAILLRDLLKAKFIDKPIGSGEAGYMLNVSPQGDMDYAYITKQQLDNLSTEKILKGVSINQGMINYSKGLFS